MLLERPGEVITREELQARLWPTDTFVGFDEGINTAIRYAANCPSHYRNEKEELQRSH
ncbi:MAG: hypothetical protein WA800_18460 [Terriglobales bacterium]